MPKTKTPQQKKEKAVLKEKVEAVKKSSARLMSFTVTAVIPTQSYGNIQPSVTVEAGTIEDAKDFALPIIHELYVKYSENVPAPFRPVVSATEKVVEVERTVAEKVVDAWDKQVKNESKSVKKSEESLAAEYINVPTYEAFAKASKAIEAAVSREALDLVEGQIKKSVKIQEEDKPTLFSYILKKRKGVK